MTFSRAERNAYAQAFSWPTMSYSVDLAAGGSSPLLGAEWHLYCTGRGKNHARYGTITPVQPL